MKALLLLITALLFIPQIGFAQETPEPTAWTTEQRCVTTFSEPPEGWSYDGVIFTFREGDGIHARRADLPTRYYVTFDVERLYSGAGAFSPDGRWYAVPTGSHLDEDKTSLDNQYHIRELRVYSTTPEGELYRIDWNWSVFTNATDIGIFPQWLDNEHILYPSGSDYRFEWFSINPFSGEVIPYNDLMPLSFIEHVQGLGIPSELFSGKWVRLIEDFSSSAFRLSADERQFVFNHPTLQIGDISRHTIIDTCIRPEFPLSAFSPTGEQVAFGLNEDGFVYILDIEAWEAYRLDLAANNVVGWYPLP